MKLTLGLSELALVDTTLDGLVELDIKRTLGCDRDLVVRDHILLDGLTARIGNQVSIDGSEKGGGGETTRSWNGGSPRRDENKTHKNVPATVALLQLYTERPVSNQ